VAHGDRAVRRGYRTVGAWGCQGGAPGRSRSSRVPGLTRADPGPYYPGLLSSPNARHARERDSLRAVLDSIGREADVAPLLARVLEHACALLDADHGVIGLTEHDVVRPVAIRDMPSLSLGVAVPAGVGLVGQVLGTGAAVRVGRYADLPTPTLHGLSENAMIGVPVRWGDAMVGVFALGRAPRDRDVTGAPRRRAFTRRDVATLEAFARHVAVAVHNARRLEEERRRAERLAVIARIGQLVTADLQLDDLLQRVADAIHELLGYDNVAVALTVPDDPHSLEIRSFGGTYKHAIGGRHKIPLDRGLIGAAVRSREVVLVNDASADPRYLATPGTDGRQAELVLPLLHGGRTLGALNLERRRPFDDEDVRGLRVVADQLAVAIENAHLYAAAQRAAVLEERHRLARELHDSVTQQLFSATLVAQALGPAYARDPAEGARRAAMLLDLTRGALGEMRTLLGELRPGDPAASAEPPAPDAGLARLGRGGLLDALRAHVATGAYGDLAIALEDDGYTPQAPAREEALYRIAREALHNVVKHGRASRAEVRVGAHAGVLRLAVRDDGRGFDARTTRTRTGLGGLGLLSMRERAAEQGGALRVESAPGRGTLVEVALPLNVEGMP
jgi:signal transduction histidine kinase